MIVIDPVHYVLIGLLHFAQKSVTIKQLVTPPSGKRTSMNHVRFFTLVLTVCVFNGVRAQDSNENISVQKIYDKAPHSAFTDLIRWNDRFYCAFRTGSGHVPGENGEDGKVQLISSVDGNSWTEVATIELDSVDLRDPKLSITPTNRLMILMGGSYYDGTKLLKRIPKVAFVEPNGQLTDVIDIQIDDSIKGPNDWLWRVTWKQGQGFGVVYQNVGNKWGLHLVSTIDGINFKKIQSFSLPNRPNEATVRFAESGEMWIVVRNEGGNQFGHLGICSNSKDLPFEEWNFDDWQWRRIKTRLGGPNMIQLPEGPWILGTRKYLKSGAKTMLGVLGRNASFREMIEFPSGGDTSYPGMLVYDNQLWVSYYSSHESRSSIYLAKVSVDTIRQQIDEEMPFGADFPNLESKSTGEWWKIKEGGLLVPRDQVIGFAVYAHDRGILKLSAQFYPLKPEEAREVRLEFKQDGEWKEVAKQPIHELGWSAHFRLENWDNSKDVEYRLRHGEKAQFVGLIRKDPIDKEEIVVGSLSCNSSRTPGPRPQIIENLKKIDPDFLFFAGDQSYHHTQHTFGWLEWGVQFRDVLRNRPVVAIPDDHDVGQANIWGENGKKATNPSGPSGGFFYPAKYVNMVQRCQTWHLPDPFDPTPIERGIGVYYTRLRVGGIDFAIIEDRKFKSGPLGKIPKMGPRPDHINDPGYDRKAVDLPGLKLLGDRQLKFLNAWSQDWTGAEMKCVLSQTAFCGAVHLHGKKDNRLLADLDSNAWPQTGRNKALTELRRCWATHLCGDQHLSVVVKHGIESPRDGPYGFTSPAIVNTIYGRWWHPEDEKPGKNSLEGSPLPWTGDYQDGLGNHIHMMAYANPEDVSDQLKRADGFGIARFNKKNRTIKFECWPRFAEGIDTDENQFPGWPITIDQHDNDGRIAAAWLPEISVSGIENPVVQVIDESQDEILFTVRMKTNKFRLPVYSSGNYTVKIGRDKPDLKSISGISSVNEGSDASLSISID